MNRRTLRRYVYAGIAVLLAWALGAVWVGPHFIRAGYRQESLRVINDVFAGRAEHPVEFYLGIWRSVAVRGTVVLLAGWSIGFLSLRFGKLRRAVIAKAVGGTEDLDGRSLVWFGLGLGLLGGCAEVGYRWLRQLLLHRSADRFFPELLWMGPYSAALLGLLIAILLLCIARAGGIRVGVRKAAALFGFCAIYGVAQSDGIALYPVAEVVLSAGLAAVLARLAVARANPLRRLILRSRPYLAGSLIVIGVFATLNLPTVTERRALAGRSPAAAGLPNILLFILDTVRAANLGLYGYERPTMPRLNNLAETGVTFSQAYSVAPWTLPSHAGIFTGRYSFETGTGGEQPLDGTYPTLAETLAAHGYRTGGFVANLLYTTRTSGLNRGFDRYEDVRLNVEAFLRSSWLPRTLVDHVPPLTTFFEHVAKNGGHVTNEFLNWSNTTSDRPFFAFMNYFDAHAPYESPEPFSSKFGPHPRGWFYNAGWRETPDTPYDAAQLQPWLNLYDGALSFIDHQIETILDTLDARGILENTIVVVTADHGEMWGEHGEIDHAKSLYEPVLHVPLVIRFPGRIPAHAWVDSVVSLRDLAATILDLVGFAERDPFAGTTLAPLWEGATEAAPRSPALAELSHWQIDKIPFWAPVNRGDMATLFSDGYHYIRNGDGIEELYNLDEDPGELVDLSGRPEFDTTLLRMREVLDSIRHE